LRSSRSGWCEHSNTDEQEDKNTKTQKIRKSELNSKTQKKSDFLIVELRQVETGEGSVSGSMAPKLLATT
jgi:hypothetical protein